MKHQEKPGQIWVARMPGCVTVWGRQRRHQFPIFGLQFRVFRVFRGALFCIDSATGSLLSLLRASFDHPSGMLCTSSLLPVYFLFSWVHAWAWGRLPAASSFPANRCSGCSDLRRAAWLAVCAPARSCRCDPILPNRPTWPTGDGRQSVRGDATHARCHRRHFAPDSSVARVTSNRRGCGGFHPQVPPAYLAGATWGAPAAVIPIPGRRTSRCRRVLPGP